MKIQYALMSCTANTRYTEYWPTVAAEWLKFGITPVCLFIPHDPMVKLPKAPGGIVHTIPPYYNIEIDRLRSQPGVIWCIKNNSASRA